MLPLATNDTSLLAPEWTLNFLTGALVLATVVLALATVKLWLTEKERDRREALIQRHDRVARKVALAERVLGLPNDFPWSLTSTTPQTSFLPGGLYRTGFPPTKYASQVGTAPRKEISSASRAAPPSPK